MRLSKNLIAASLILSSTLVSAHGIWLEQRRGNIDVVYGHGASDDAYKTSKFHGAQAYDEQGNFVAVDIIHLDDYVRLRPHKKAAVIAAVLNNGKYSEMPDGSWLNHGRTQAPNAKVSMQAWKYSLNILRPNATLPELDQLKVAIIPEVDPLSLKPGDKLPVKVLVDGKPAAGVAIIPDYRAASSVTEGKTDANGRAQVTILNNGLNVIGVSHTAKVSGNPDYEEINSMATLSFIGGN